MSAEYKSPQKSLRFRGLFCKLLILNAIYASFLKNKANAPITASMSMVGDETCALVTSILLIVNPIFLGF